MVADKMIDYPLASTTWNGDEERAILDLVSQGKTTMGPAVKKFELEFAEFFGSKRAVMVNSGSSANLLAIAALFFRKDSNLQPGMEVIVPAVSWATTYYPITQYGLKLKFVDIDLDSLCMNIDQVAEAITSRTAGILAVNLLGQPAELSKLRSLADQHGIFLIEDNCESMGAKIDGKYAGTWGDLGTFSTFFSHHICTMEGGVIVTDDDELADICASLRAHGWTRELSDSNFVFQKNGSDWEDKFRFVLPGYNLRPLELSGAVGSVQLKKLPNFVDQRIQNQKFFHQLFNDFPDLRIQSGPGVSSAFGFSFILEGKLRGQREKIVNLLESVGVQTRPIVAGNFAKQPVLKWLEHLDSIELVNANHIHNDGFFIGNHHFDVGDKLQEIYNLLKMFANE